MGGGEECSRTRSCWWKSEIEVIPSPPLVRRRTIPRPRIAIHTTATTTRRITGINSLDLPSSDKNPNQEGFSGGGWSGNDSADTDRVRGHNDAPRALRVLHLPSLALKRVA